MESAGACDRSVFVVAWKAATHRQGCAPPQLLWPTLLILLYAATYAFLPPLLRALIAVTAIGCTLCSLRFGKSFDAGAFGLLYLSLPLIPSLQFYGGYPLRVLVACAAAPILRLGGFAVMRDGTCLNWSGQLIWIDAPCSGIRMLWVGLYLACASPLLKRFGKQRYFDFFVVDDRHFH